MPSICVPLSFPLCMESMGVFVVIPFILDVIVNGKSLSWMGLTRERWCCTMGLMSRLDMNTCQTNMKTDILF